MSKENRKAGEKEISQLGLFSSCHKSTEPKAGNYL